MMQTPRTTQLRTRQYAEAAGSLAMSVWLLPDFSIVHQKQTNAEYLSQRFTKPDPTARMVLAAGGQRRLDTIDGRPHFGDVWEHRGFICVQIGDYEDFEFEEIDQHGKGQKVVSAGNLLYLPRSAFLTTRPYTLRTPIPGITIVNDVLEVSTPASMNRQPVDRKLEVHHSISFDAASSGTSNADSVTVSHIVGTGSDRHLLSGLTWIDETLTPVSCVFNTTETMTDLGGAQELTVGRMLEHYGLVAPTETTANVVGTISGASFFTRLGNTSRFGVDQTTPNRSYFSFTSPSTSTPSITVTDSQNTDVVADCLITAQAPTVGAGQTQRINTGNPATQAQSDESASGANTVMSWSLAAASAVAYGAIALVDANPVTCTPSLTLLGVGRCTVIVGLEWLRRRKNKIRRAA